MPRKLTTAIAAIILFAIPNFAQAGDAEMDQQNILATVETMTAAFAKGDIDTIMSTYEPGASVVATPGSPVLGDQALRAMFRNFIDAGVDFRL